MIIRTIRDILSEKVSVVNRCKNLIKFGRYYKNLLVGISSGEVYHELENQNQILLGLTHDLTQKDLDLIDILFRKDVKAFLEKRKLETHLDFSKKFVTNQIGYNTIYIDKPTAGLWTTGIATFFIPTKIGLTNKIIIEFSSVPPMTVSLGFEKKIWQNIRLKKLETKKVELIIKSQEVEKPISEIFITTDRLWLPSKILQVEDSVALGILVKSVNVSYLEG
ncbi:MAG TPA: hypothetical protein VLD38_07800 [Nitrosopumilaceae archaeon]|nr:hypothetical protein [Nitrosopumilaceae archaeon]